MVDTGIFSFIGVNLTSMIEMYTECGSNYISPSYSAVYIMRTMALRKRSWTVFWFIAYIRSTSLMFELLTKVSAFVSIIAHDRYR